MDIGAAIKAIRERVCAKCHAELAVALAQDHQNPARAENARAMGRAPYCGDCLNLALAPLGAGPAAVGRVGGVDACPECYAVMSRPPLPGAATIPAGFLKAVMWAYLCAGCTEKVIRSAMGAPSEVRP